MSIDAKLYDVTLPPGFDPSDMVYNLQYDAICRLIKTTGGVGKPIAEPDYFRGLDENQGDMMKLGLNSAMSYGGVVREIKGEDISLTLTKEGMEIYKALIESREYLKAHYPDYPQPQKA